MPHRSEKLAMAPLVALIVPAFGLLLAVSPARAESWWDTFFHRPGETAPAAAPKATPRPLPTVAAPAPVAPAPSGASAPIAVAPAPAPVVLPSVPVAYPKVQRVSEFLEVAGVVAAANDVKLVARVPGYLDQVNFRDGQRVEQGDLLFTIEQDQYQAQLAQAEAQVQAIQAALEYARTQAERYQALQRKGAAAQVVVDNWNFQAKKTEAELANANAQLDLARINLRYTEVRAPFAGQMGKLLQNVGSMVGGSGQSPLVAEIVQLDPIFIEASVSEKDFLAFRENVGDKRLSYEEMLRIPVDIAIASEPAFHLRGKVEYVAPAVDSKNGTILVRGIVHNPDRSLLPGLDVRMRLPRGKVLANAVLVPDRAIQTNQAGRYVLVVNRQNVIEQRQVQLGELVGNLRIATQGVRPDDRLVIADLWRATPGLKVNPKLIPIDQAETVAAGSQ